MIDDSTFEQFYRDVTPDVLERFKSFLATHTLETAEIESVRVPYYACGQGARTLLTFCGGHSMPYTVWETVEAYERDHRVLVLDLSGFGDVAALSHGVNEVLSREGVERVVLLGTSLGGLLAQIYLRHHSQRVDGVILMNTGAFKPGGHKPVALVLTRLLPERLIRWIFLKKLRAYFATAMADPRAAEAGRFPLAHLEHVMARHFTKRKLLNILSVLYQFGREGHSRADYERWRGRALIVSSEDDDGFEDVAWFLDNLPNAESHILPKGLGHLPQLVYRDRIEAEIRSFLARMARLS